MNVFARSIFFVATLSLGCASASPPPAPVCVASTPPAATAPATATSIHAIPFELPRVAMPLAPADPAAFSGRTVLVPLTAVLVVDVDKTGAVHANRRRLATVEDLVAIAREEKAKDPDVRAVIRADRDVSYGNVIEVLDALKRGGLERIAFGVEPKKSSP
jgi:biopolymer transport protein ExbD